MKHVSKWMVLLIVILLAAVGGILALASGPSGPGKYDEFAECLSLSGTTMYGTFWCPHCANQKALFGSSFKYINYIECSSADGRSQLPECRAAGINSYPTWEFADGSRVEGELSLQQLSQRTDCALNITA